MKYIIAFVVILAVSAGFRGLIYDAGKVPAAIAIGDVGPSELGVWKRRDPFIPEIKMTESARIYRFVTGVSDRHENRDADLPDNH
ncbi:MAG: hypothetical protein J0H83_14830 [Candidatus Melainabacteria bacterium]|jgi:hypothetical protein|nr:hypothetical protein [Candidatus Melainabacteria bacterium]MBX9673222.1 hypothetical protein [Candidatus Obscuribacterales bacterium]